MNNNTNDRCYKLPKCNTAIFYHRDVSNVVDSDRIPVMGHRARTRVLKQILSDIHTNSWHQVFFSFFFALSRLNLIPDPAEAASGPTTPDYLDIHRNELPGDIYPLRISLPSSAQRKDTSIQTQLHHSNSGYITKEVRGGSECYAVVYLNDKIVVPRIPRGRSDALGHPLHRSDKSIHRLGRR